MTEQQREDVRQRYLLLNTAIICDVYDELDWPVRALSTDVRRRTEPRRRVAGWATTIEGRLMDERGADKWKLEIVDSLQPGSVPVWSGTDADGFCLFGDLIAATMQKRGCAGAVTDAGFRDVEAISETEFTVFARYVSPVQSIGRWRVTSHDEPVTLRSAWGERVTVTPGDFVLADEDGVVIVEQDRVMRVLERAEEIVRMEEEARGGGLTAQEMLEKYGHV